MLSIQLHGSQYCSVIMAIFSDSFNILILLCLAGVFLVAASYFHHSSVSWWSWMSSVVNTYWQLLHNVMLIETINYVWSDWLSIAWVGRRGFWRFSHTPRCSTDSRYIVFATFTIATSCYAAGFYFFCVYVIVNHRSTVASKMADFQLYRNRYDHFVGLWSAHHF